MMPPPEIASNDKPQLLLTSSFMQKLDQLDVLSRKILAGKLRGERRSKKKGRSVEFADYRSYTAGDDLRLIDWNLYARLDRLFLRLFEAEEDLSVSILIDITRSMDFGEPNKMAYAKRLAAALGYIGLVHHNRVSLYSFTDRLVDRLVNIRSRRFVPRLLAFLQAQTPRQAGNLSQACRAFAMASCQKGVVILISDFLDKGSLNDALRYLNGHLYDVVLIQVLAPQEIDPEVGSVVGDLHLTDCEDHEGIDVSVGPALLRRYRDNLIRFCDQQREKCTRRGVEWLSYDTTVPIETLVLRYLRERNFLG